VVSLPHPTRHRTSHVSPSNLVKLINFDGFGVLGASSTIWREEGLLDEIMALQDQGLVRLRSLFQTELDDEKCFYYVAVLVVP
jgi:hypothetical protein